MCPEGVALTLPMFAHVGGIRTSVFTRITLQGFETGVDTFVGRCEAVSQESFKIDDLKPPTHC